MPLKNTGKEIKKIKINKKNVIITFNDKSKLEVTPEALTVTYLYVGKSLDNKTINELKAFSKNAKLLKYAMSLLKRGHYSEWKMREKLYAKEANKHDVDLIIKQLKEHDLINDQMLVLDWVEYGEERLIGKNKILQELSNKGIFEEQLKKIKFNHQNEKKKALANLPKLEKKYAKYAYEQKKQHIYHGLISLGFDNDIVNEVINKIKAKDNKDEKEKLNKDLKKVYERLSRKYEDRELKEKVFASLRSKGYKLNEIIKEWENIYGEIS